MKKIYSLKFPDKLLHIVNRNEDFDGRTDLVPNDQYLQMAAIRFPKNKKLRSHYHLWKNVEYEKYVAQESWIVIEGRVKVYYYDIDNELICSEIISRGDCTITLEGGHGYEILDDNTIIYECKTGPYYGQLIDKTFIE